MSRSGILWVVLVVLAWISVPVLAGPIGLEMFTVNTYTVGAQERSSPAFYRDGEFVVAWDSDRSPRIQVVSQPPNDSDGYSIRAARFDGIKRLGGEFQVNSYTTGDQRRPRTASNRGGSFVVVWESADGPGEYSVRGQRFDSAGMHQGAEIQISQDIETPPAPRVAMNSKGGFIAVWHSDGPGTDGDGTAVRARHFDSSGTPQGSDFQVNEETAGDQKNAVVGIRSGSEGDFVVVWESNESIKGKIFNSNGPDISEFLLNADQGAPHHSPSLTRYFDTNVGITWVYDCPEVDADCVDSSSLCKIGAYGFSFPKEQPPDPGGFRLSAPGLSCDSHPDVGQETANLFVVVWQHFSADASRLEIRGRGFNSDDNPNKEIFRVNQCEAGLKGFPAIAHTSGRKRVVTWGSDFSGGADSDGFDIRGRRAPGDLVFTDGFECGDALGWSSVVDSM